MELRQLRYFVAVAEELHFSRAAARLYVAQPALSHQIAKLERELGVTLLRRSTRSVELTPAGELFLLDARELLCGLDLAAERARVANGASQRLSVGMGTGVGPPALRQLGFEFADVPGGGCVDGHERVGVSSVDRPAAVCST